MPGIWRTSILRTSPDRRIRALKRPLRMLLAGTRLVFQLIDVGIFMPV